MCEPRDLLLYAARLIDRGRLSYAAQVLRVVASEHLDAEEDGAFRSLAALIRLRIAELRASAGRPAHVAADLPSNVLAFRPAVARA